MSPRVLWANYTLSGLLLSLTAALILEGAFRLPLIAGWLIGINVVAFVFYFIDKLNAEFVGKHPAAARAKLRIPEAALLLLAAAGGSPGALLAMLWRRHKIKKFSFMLPFVLILILQGAALYFLRDRLPWRLPGL